MALSGTATPATACAVKPALNCEQLGGQLDSENSPSDNGSQAETALGELSVRPRAEGRPLITWETISDLILIEHAIPIL